MRSLYLRALDLLWPGHPKTPRGVWDRVVPILLNSLRLTIACIVAYFLTVVVPQAPLDMTGTLTALLVMQASAQSSAKMALVRVGAVLTGVAVALGVSLVLGLHWWSLALVIFATLVLAKAFRLNDQALEVPISGMLILASFSQPIAAETRVVTTLVGAAVGMVMPLILPPPIPARRASGAVGDVARRLHDIFDETARRVEASTITRETCAEGLDGLRDATTLIARANDKIADAQDLRKWNTRAVGTADVVPLLKTAIDTLDRCLLASRVLFLTVTEEAPEEPTVYDGFGDDIRHAFAAVLDDIGDCLEAYGALVQAEAGGIQMDAERLFEERVSAAHGSRTILTNLVAASPHDTEGWMLHGSILASIDHLLDYLDVEARVRAQRDWRTSQEGRAVPPDFAQSARLSLLRRRRQRRRIVAESPPAPDLQADFLGNDQATEVIPAPKRRRRVSGNTPTSAPSAPPPTDSQS